MGCDGGTIPKRDELVKTKQKPEQKDKQAELNFLWGHCTVTQQPLQKPIVGCQLGRLYSKECVIQGLLDGIEFPLVASHVRAMRDIRELQLTVNPAYENLPTTSEAKAKIAPYICPLIGLEMNGNFRFVFIWTCGCVMSERALKHVTSTNCLKCQKPFSPNDVVILNGNEEDVELMKTRMADRKLKIKKNKKVKEEPTASTSAPAKATVKRVAAGGSKVEDPQFKKTKANYSVAKDPKATEVYKSLFTSHKTANQREKAHWVTYNPFYN